MIVKEIKCESLLNESKLADYCINCYVGCGHGCKYCYADSITRRFSKHKEPWGEFVDVKINAPDILKNEILKKEKGSVFISSLTDPYQPLERKYELTRRCLEILLGHQFPVIIQTKSSLVLRDMDLLKKFKDCEVGLTITLLDDDVRKKFEPLASSISERFETLSVLNNEGIRTYVFFGPILPYLSDINIDGLFEKIKELKIDHIFVDKLNLKSNTWQNIRIILEKNYPEMIEKWQSALYEPEYYRNLKTKIKSILSNRIRYNFCF